MSTNNITTYVAMDVHKKQHAVAFKAAGQDKAITEFTLNNSVRDIKKAIKKIKKNSNGPVICCYESGCLGFALARQIKDIGAECKVIAPSLVPRRPGDKIKTDRRDALKLLEYLENGQLVEVLPPSEEQEAVRDLCRAREKAQEDLMRIRHQISKMLLRNGFVYKDGTHWTQKHLNWVKTLDLGNPLVNEVLADLYEELQHRMDRCKQLEESVEKIAQQEPYKSPVAMLCCFKGIKTISAMTIISELYSFERFSNPNKLMKFLGLIPSEHTSADKIKKGGITRAGNKRVRRILIEAAWHQRNKPIVSQVLRKRREGQEQWVINIANKCMKRLYKKYWHLVQKGKSHHCAVVAVARELIGFIWDVLHTHLEIATK